MANYHYVHNLWQSVRGDSEHFYVLVISLFIKKNKIIFIFAMYMYQNFPLALIDWFTNIFKFMDEFFFLPET